MEFKAYASSSNGNLYSISDGATTIMIECGIAWKKVMHAFQFKTSEVVGVCITHSHLDHARSAQDAAAAGLDVYMMHETREALGLSGHRIHEIELLKSFKLGTITVLAFPLEHDAPNCGFLFVSEQGEKAVYITDTAYCRYRFSGLNLICIECNYAKETMAEDINPAHKIRVMRSHMSLDTLLGLLAANDISGVRELHLLHLSDDNSDEAMFKDKVQAATGIPVCVAQR